MKRYYFLISICMLFMAFANSCNKEKSQKNIEISDVNSKARLLSYGFYKEDNVGLKKDFIAQVQDEIHLLLPEELDRSGLVARFSVSDRDEVMVGGQIQESGKTSNDFSYPVDYIVHNKECNLSKLYTVEIGKLPSRKWMEAGIFTDGENSLKSLSMCVNPKEGLPAFFLTRNQTVTVGEGEDSKQMSVEAGIVATYNDGEIVSNDNNLTFDADNETLVRCRYPDITADKDGNIYVAYYLYIARDDFKTIVRKSDGTLIGQPFCKTKNGQYLQLERDPESGDFLCATYANSAIGAIKRRGLNLCYNKNGDWTSENYIPAFGDNEVHKVTTCVANNHIYMGGQLAGRGKQHSYFIYQYDNGSWKKIINSLPTNMSAAAQMCPSPIAIASDGTSYMLAGNDSNENGKWFITLMKANQVTGLWEKVASPIIDNSEKKPLSRRSEYLLALVDDKPMVVYLNQDNPDMRYPCVLTFDDETKDWNAPIKLADVPVMSGTLNFAFNSEGVGFISFIDNIKDANHSLYLYKYDFE